MKASLVAGLIRHRNRAALAAVVIAIAVIAGVLAAGDERDVNFIRPGLAIQVTGATIATDGTLRVGFKLSDPRGLPLDREGITTPGVVGLSFVAAYIPQDGTQYRAYTVRTQTSPINGKAAIQGSSDTGGRYERIAEGEYAYTFGTKLPATLDRSATHSVLIYGSRNLTEFDMGTNRKDTVYSWVPAGGAVAKVRDVVRTATCNGCHVDMGFHGGNRKSVEGCVMCHQPQTTDPDTGNTVDFPVMVHKIHMGQNLPTVKEGKKYCIIGNGQSENCYDKVNFVAGANNCKVCHDTDLKAAERPAQVDAHWKNPNRAACGSCHEKVNFETGEGHLNLPQPNDRLCSTCHIAQGELEYDASIVGAHTIGTKAPSLPGTVFEIVSVDDGVAGKKPRITFTIKDKKGEMLRPSQLNSASLILAGPTSDYSTYVSESVLTAAQDAGGGRFAYTFNAVIPATAKGSFTIGMQGYRNITLLPGTTKAVTVRDIGANVVKHFSVDGKPVEPRRQVVATEKCNTCHGSLALHGGSRNRTELCVLCHNPTMTDRRTAETAPAESINFSSMVHRIHSGEEQEREFTIGGQNFNNAGYPGILSRCDSCHVNNSQRLPLSDKLMPVTDPRGYITKPGPTAAACLTCHVTRSAAAHAAINSNEIGESCATCHGPNAEFSVDRVHAPPQ